MLNLDFNNNSKPKILYHGSTSHIKDVINTSGCFNCLETEWGQFVFAGTSLDAAYAYALKTKECVYQSGNIILFDNRDSFMRRQTKGYIYALKPDLFENVIDHSNGETTEEWV